MSTVVHMPGRRRRLHPLPLLAGIALALLTLQLGNWQTRRASEKAAQQTEYAAASASPLRTFGAAPPAEWQVVELRGKWLEGRSILVDNRLHQGRAGYHVHTPLQLAGQGSTLLVNRGWIGAGPDRAHLPQIPEQSGEVTVLGRVRRPSEKPFTLGADDASPSSVVWQTLDLQRYRRQFGLGIADFYVQQSGDALDGLIRDWPAPDAGVDRHRGYALQWYALAVLATALTVGYVGNALRSVSHGKHESV